jgi:hypothetical protein
VAYFEDFLFNRLGWMDVSFPGTILHPWAGISAESKKIKVLLYGDYFSRQELSKSNFRLNNAPEGVNILNVVYVNASECTIMLNANVSSLPALSITVSEKAINYWEDITSNPLGATGISEPQTTLPDISLFEENHLLHIRCSLPEWLPEYSEIISLTGQRVATIKLEKKTENIQPHQLKPGFYLMMIKTEGTPVMLKFSVGK